MDAIQDILPEEYKSEVVDTEGIVLVDFWGDDCPPCFIVEKWLTQLSDVWAGQVAIKKIYLANPDIPLVRQLGIRGIPTLILFENGREIGRLASEFTQDDLRAMVAPYLS